MKLRENALFQIAITALSVKSQELTKVTDPQWIGTQVDPPSDDVNVGNQADITDFYLKPSDVSTLTNN